MTRNDIFETLNEIVVKKGLLKEEEFIRIDDSTVVLIDSFLDMFKDYDLTLSSLQAVDSVGWKARFVEWNKKGILPD